MYMSFKITSIQQKTSTLLSFSCNKIYHSFVKYKILLGYRECGFDKQYVFFDLTWYRECGFNKQYVFFQTELCEN